MDEQTTWKGHTFTLLVFAGIVVLSAIFFILGMLVGRVQAQKISGTGPTGTSSKADAKLQPKEEISSLMPSDYVRKDETPIIQSVSPRLDPQPVEIDPPKKGRPVPETPARPPDTSSNVVNYQVGALRKGPDAEKLLNELKKKGFRAFILSPPADDQNPLFRVQVGPFSDLNQAQDVKKKLEMSGYKPLVKK
jgi:cell division septation protein DedD